VIVSSHRVVVRNNKQQTEIRNSDAIILAFSMLSTIWISSSSSLSFPIHKNNYFFFTRRYLVLKPYVNLSKRRWTTSSHSMVRTSTTVICRYCVTLWQQKVTWWLLHVTVLIGKK